MRFGRWMAGLAILAWMGAAEPTLAGVMSKAEFRLEVRDAILRLAPDVKFEFVDEDTLRVGRHGKKPSAEGLQLFLGAQYARYLNAPDEAQVVIDRVARLAIAADEPGESATRENLIVLVRPVEYVEQPGAEKMNLIWRPFAGDFVEVVAVDAPETFQLADGEKVDLLFPTRDATWKAALANTRKRMGALEVERLSEGVWAISSESGLSLSVLEDPEAWRVNGVTISADPWAVLLQRNLLLLVEGGDKERLAKLSAFLDEMSQSPETFSTIFQRHAGVWSSLEQRP